MSLIDEIKIKSLSDAQEILKSAGSEDIFEKAHKDGDLHPNGKWVWVSSAAGGKGDWRTLNGRTHKKHQAANAAGGNGGGSKESGGNTGASSPTVKKPSVANEDKSSKSKKSSGVKVDMDTIDQAEYNRMYNQAKSVDKQGRLMGLSVITSNINKVKKDLEETISNRPGAKATIKKLQDNLTKFISQKKAAEDVINEIDKNNSKSDITGKTETYSHDINGVSVNVSKNKDGSYTLEANGKKVKSDDPSFFKDKLTPRVKKALAKEVGIDVKNPAKQFDIKRIGNFISSIKITHGDVIFIPKSGAIYLDKGRDKH